MQHQVVRPLGVKRRRKQRLSSALKFSYKEKGLSDQLKLKGVPHRAKRRRKTRLQESKRVSQERKKTRVNKLHHSVAYRNEHLTLVLLLKQQVEQFELHFAVVEKATRHSKLVVLKKRFLYLTEYKFRSHK